jgi:drug/metabolite transporter (DMT)-like permease
MTIAGISWGIYTIKGQTSKNPLRDTTYNFIKTLPFITILYIATMTQSNYSTEGILLAVIAGGVTSGIGYTIWYMAIRGLSSIQSAVLQLLVPVIAAFSGVIFISEIITVRLTVSSILILGGVLIVTLYKYSLRNNPGT